MKRYILTAVISITSIIAFGNTHLSNNKLNTISRISSTVYFEINPIDEVIKSYLQVKNALASDNSKDASKAGEQLKAALTNLGKEAMNKNQKKVYKEVVNEIIDNTSQIANNGDNIKIQRSNFENLNKNIFDLVKAFGTSQTLYKDYCPMKNAYWLSEIKDIKNPYYGNDMLSCGTIKETINKK